MKFFFSLISAIMLTSSGMMAENLLKAIPFEQVTLEDNFWRPRLIIQKETLVPFALDKVRPAMDNLRKTGQFLKGDKSELPFPHRFVASDLYKVMEGAAYLLTLEKDPALEHTMDSIIDLIGAAQKPDGYLYEAHTTGVSAQHEHWGGGGMGDRPYSWVVHSHELYNMGHMYEGAAAWVPYMASRASDRSMNCPIWKHMTKHVPQSATCCSTTVCSWPKRMESISTWPRSHSTTTCWPA